MLRIGKIVATHGLNGSLILTHVIGSSDWMKKDQSILVEMQKGSLIPFFVTKFKANNPKEYIIDIEDINKVGDAKKLVTKQVYVDEMDLTAYIKKSPLLWIGFNLVDSQKGRLGMVEDVLQTGNQWIAKFTYQNKEVLVPLVDQTVDGLDTKGRNIHVTLPEGLLEVYLNS